jgi:hypothetical protein
VPPVAQGVSRGLRVRQQGARARQQQGAGFGQQHLPAGPVEQRRLQRRLQLGNALAHGRLGQMQAGRSGREAAAVGHGDKCSELGQIHMYSTMELNE